MNLYNLIRQTGYRHNHICRRAGIRSPARFSEIIHGSRRASSNEKDKIIGVLSLVGYTPDRILAAMETTETENLLTPRPV